MTVMMKKTIISTTKLCCLAFLLGLIFYFGVLTGKTIDIKYFHGDVFNNTFHDQRNVIQDIMVSEYR